MRKIYVNGKFVPDKELMKIKPGDTVFVTDTADEASDTAESTSVKESRLGKAKAWVKAHPWKTLAVLGGGAAIMSRVFGQQAEVEEDEEDVEETETEEEEEE